MLSRREFVARSAAAAALITLPFDPRESRRSTHVLVDLGEHCALRESLLGYARALSSTVIAPWRTTGTVIVPGANHIESPTARLILTSLQRGGTVLLESGAAFGNFPRHRDQLREYFQLLVEPPIELWPARGIPYVEYAWPVSTKVRDFSRVVPIAPQHGKVIGMIHEMPVALARRAGRGMLVFLGSPLGPALWAGDAAARRWLAALLTLGAARQT